MEVIKAQVLVLGAGPGGYAAAFLAADKGLSTVLVDAWVRSIEQATYCVATPQYNTWTAFVRDRAGNASPPSCAKVVVK